MNLKTFAAAGLLGLSLAGFTGVAQAVPITSWTNITNNSASNLSGQLVVDVTSYSATQVSFKFTNNVGIASSITDIYFDDKVTPLLSSPALMFESAGVDFGWGASPGNLPGGNTVNFVATVGLASDSEPPAAPNGINSSTEWLELVFNLVAGSSFADVLAQLASNDLVIGMHIQAIGDNDKSDSYISTPPPRDVPEPASLALLGAGLLGLAALRRRRV